MKILVILGHKLLPNNKPSKVLIERLHKGYEIYKKGGYSKVIVSGGRVEKKSYHTEAFVMKKFLINTLGLNKECIICESISKTTIENAKYCKIIIDKMSLVKSITIISSHFHIKRVEKIFNTYYDMYSLNFISSKNGVNTNKLKIYTRNEQKYFKKFIESLQVTY